MRLLLLLPWALLVACGHVTPVRPVPEGTLQPELSVGGPVARVGGTPLPVPLSTVGARYGLSERLDVGAHVHLTSLLFGVAGVDVGSTYLLLPQQQLVPALAVSGRLYGFGDLRSGPRAYLEVTGSASTLLAERFLTYVSATGLVQFAGGAPLWALSAGEEVRLGRFGLQAELRWYQPHVPTRFQVVEWNSVAGQGAWGLTLGASYRFGGEEP